MTSVKPDANFVPQVFTSYITRDRAEKEILFLRQFFVLLALYLVS